MQDQIKKAIGAHGLWKGRLKDAIETGKSEFTVAGVTADNNCEFGKWLQSLGEAGAGSKSHYDNVRRLHAAFHKEVGKVLGQALAGKRDEAGLALGPGTPYSNYSGELIREMMDWAKKAA